VRELLLQEARVQGIAADPQTDDKGRRETEEDALIRQLLEQEVSVPDADTETCRRYYENNQQRFCSPDLYEPSHILLAASAEETQAYGEAAREAAQLIALLSERPENFEAFARDRSNCTSKESGGRLGQVTRADVVPEFATFLCNLEEGQLCPVPVKTRYGVHVLRLDLQEASWRRAVAQYIKLLAGRAAIEGVAMEAADSPLVQ
jgi:peptidyl-prolyl cis-trans isomerase C